MKPVEVFPVQVGGPFPQRADCRRRFPAFAGMTRRSGMATCAGLLFLSLACDAAAIETSGLLKLRADTTRLPGDSLLRDVGDEPMRDQAMQLRANLAGRASEWRWRVDYQLQAVRGDRVDPHEQSALPGFGAGPVAADEARLFDLAHRIDESGERVVSHRLDRFYIGRSDENSVVRVGRQAVSWGNGLVYNPVDFFNPFDPAAIDTEYKTGDDMLYAQYLLESGDDLQAVWVARRDEQGDIDSEVASLALKFHGFAARGEYDLLVAGHYDSAMLAVGGAADLAGSVWRGDLLFSDDEGEIFTSAVLNWSYSRVVWNKNIGLNIEYFRNGFGIDDGAYGPAALAANPGLLRRIERGELFSLGQNYLAVAALIELTPLWLTNLTLFNNLDDDSRLLQLTSEHDLAQDLRLLLALSLPDGGSGSEFGGIDSAVPGKTLAIGESLTLQLGWYF